MSGLERNRTSATPADAGAAPGLPVLDVRQILERLPHRYPLLLVDRVIAVKESHHLAAWKNVTFNEDFFRGHFPGNPLMPGVLIVEALAQAAGLLISLSAEKPEGIRPYLVGLDGVKFRRPVVPGDRLLLEVDVLARRRRYWRFQGQASVDGERAAEAVFLLAILRSEEE